MTSAALAVKGPVIETRDALTLTGLASDFTMATIGGIPDLWFEFVGQLQPAMPSAPFVAYGVVLDGDGHHFRYMCGVDRNLVPTPHSAWQTVDIASRTYAVFSFPGPVSRIREVFQHIYAGWLPGSGYTVAKAPVIERYAEDFDPETGCGHIEVWLPVSTPGT